MACSTCGYPDCRCDWRVLERQRVAAALAGNRPVRTVSWSCDHEPSERGKTSVKIKPSANPTRNRGFLDSGKGGARSVKPAP